jgi:DNA-binding HxlR family transcriptional regulator
MMALLDLLGRRWALRVLWELREAAPTFLALQDRCQGMSSSVLAQRLNDLREAGITKPADSGGYALTSDGKALLAALRPLDRWAGRWAERG